ncbi:uncharacterized protein LTR77_000834 [Saxophila tyrrhenica]|uniref:Phosphoglycerate mutase-like protein n=1 Tax=Saxophila tyrrhenica TaxID=1690608 RepID=A0AAV9PQE3_9PEZI|nr:hypothetical protein LTR77_000834 [Saxophila tyrrhenica]
MAPGSRIYLTRHAQAEHNVDLDYSILDAPLTPLGRKQASSLSRLLPPSIQSRIDLLVSSPLSRTLQTTLLGYEPVISRLGGRGAVVCLPEAQECNDFPCDTGRPRSELEQIPEFKGFNFEKLTDDWTGKQGFYAPDPGSIAARARKVRQFLYERPEKEIVLVAHGDILRQITATAEAGPGVYMWRNAEMRVHRFEDEEKGGEGECFLRLEEVVEATGGYGATSTEMEVEERLGSAGGMNGHAANGKI